MSQAEHTRQDKNENRSCWERIYACFCCGKFVDNNESPRSEISRRQCEEARCTTFNEEQENSPVIAGSHSSPPPNLAPQPTPCSSQPEETEAEVLSQTNTGEKKKREYRIILLPNGHQLGYV